MWPLKAYWPSMASVILDLEGCDRHTQGIEEWIRQVAKTVTVIPDEAKERSAIQENAGSFWIPDIRLRRIPERHFSSLSPGV
jgi:hypothetical protein